MIWCEQQGLADCLSDKAGVTAPAFAANREPLLRLGCDVAPLVLAGRPVLFSHRCEAVFELKGAAALAAQLLAEGTTASSLVDLLIFKGCSANDAEAQVLGLLADWSRRNLLSMDPMDDLEDVGTYDIAGRSFRVSTTSDVQAIEPSQIFRRSAADVNAAPSSYTIASILGAVAIRCPSGALVIASPEEAAPELKSAVIGELLGETKSIALHAACLVSKGEAILLIGSPGAGKSTLAAGLSQQGFSYAGDDITLLDAGNAHGVCVAMTLKEGTQRLLAPEGSRAAESLPHRRRDGVRLAYAWPSDIARDALYPITAMVRLNRGPSPIACLEKCDPLGLMRDVLSEAFSSRGSASLGELKMLDGIFTRALSLELRYCELQDAVRLLSDRFL